MLEPSFKERFLAAAAKPLGGADRMFELGDPPDYEPDPSTSIEARGRARGPRRRSTSPTTSSRRTRAAPSCTSRSSTGSTARSTACGEMLAHPHTVPGLSDGGAHVGTICDASFPTTFLVPLGSRPRRGPARPRLPRAPAHQGHRGDRRPARPRRPRARLPGRREPHRLRRPPGAPPRDAPRPARRRQAAAPAGRRLRHHHREGAGHLRARRAHRRPARAACSAAPRRRRPDDATPVQVLEEGCAWTSDQVGDDYVWELTDADRAELDAALEHAEARTERTLDITVDDFPLPIARPAARGRRPRAHRRARRGAHPRRAGRPARPRPGVGRLLGHGRAPRAAVAAEPQGPPARRRHRPGQVGLRPHQPRQRDRRRGVPVPLRRLRPRRALLPRRRRQRRRQPRGQRGVDPQRARAHRARAGRRALRALRLRHARRGEAGHASPGT